MIVFPNAKINLELNVLRRRADGYHEIETCFYPVPWKESLEAIPAKDFSYSYSGIIIPDGGKNIVAKAFDVLQSKFDLPPVHVHLHKAIPIGAGLGGGSADGAFALKLFNDLFNLQLSDSALESYAFQLGADCAFFIKNQPALACGIGEKLEAIPSFLKGKHIIMAYPDLHISTKEAYSSIAPKVPRMSIRQIIESTPLEEWKDLLVNDFEAPLFTKYPIMGEIKEFLYQHGAIYASMTGSGSTVYGIFNTPLSSTDFLHDYTVFSGEL